MKVDARNRARSFDGKKTGRLGTEMKPAVVRVQTEERLKEVQALFEEHAWEYKIEVEADKPEDINDLNQLLNPPKPITAEQKIGRNERCPCGSGKKYKHCCGKR